MEASGVNYQYALVLTNNYNNIFLPLKLSQRIKYTCFDASNNYIIFGATSGSLYIFQRLPCNFLQLLPQKEGRVTLVAISPCEKFIAYTTVRGIACILERNDDGITNVINKSNEHGGNEITSICWTENSGRLYIGDDIGQISIINIPAFMSKKIFQLPSYIFMKLDSEIVQICNDREYLLISTKSRCYICDVNHEQYKQIGNKLREGSCGACFFKNPYCDLKMYCARPSSRIWEVNLEGSVRSTHQFKQLLAVNPTPIISMETSEIFTYYNSIWPEQSLNFHNLSVILGKYLLTYTDKGIYVFDPDKVKVVLWTNYFINIVKVTSVNDRIYLWTLDSNLYELIVMEIEKYLLQLYFNYEYSLCASVCVVYCDYIKSLKLENMLLLKPLLGLKNHILEENHNETLKKFLSRLESLNNFQNYIVIRNNSFLVNDVSNIKQYFSSNDSHDKQFYDITNGDISNADIDDENDSFDFIYNYLLQVPLIKSEKLVLFKSKMSEVGVDLTYFFCKDHEPAIGSWQVIDGNYKFIYKNDNLEINRDTNRFKLMDCKLRRNSDSVFQNKCSVVTNLIQKINNCKSDLTINFLSVFDCVFEVHICYNKFLTEELNESANISFPFYHFLTDDNIEIVRDLFEELIQSDELFNVLNLLSDKNDWENEIKKINHPILFRNIYSKDDLNFDILMSILLDIFSEILNPLKIMNLFQNCKLNCKFISWCCILGKFQKSTFVYLNSVVNDYQYNNWPLPLLLNFIELLLALEQYDSVFFIAIEGKISLNEMCYLLIKSSKYCKSSNRMDEEESINLFLDYMIKRNDSKIDSNNESKELYLIIEQVFQKLQVNGIISCNCGYPILRQDSGHLRHRIIAENLLKFYTSDNPDIDHNLSENSGKIIHSDVGYLKSVLIKRNFTNHIIAKINNIITRVPEVISDLISYDKEYFTELLPFIIQFRLLSILHDEFLNLQHCENILELSIQFSKGRCCFCKSLLELSSENLKLLNIDWNLIAKICLKSLGPNEAVNLIKKYAEDIPNGTINIRFYKACLLTRNIYDNNQRFAANLIDKYYKMCDRAGTNSSNSQNSDNAASTAKKSEEKGDITEFAKNALKVESYCKDWNTSIDSNSICSRCSLLLNSEKLIDKFGIRIFRCGHFYHIVCLQLSKTSFICPVCN